MSSPHGTHTGYHIEPYHMNGLNWKLAPCNPKRNNITIVTGFMPDWWEEEYGITFRREFHAKPDVHKQTLVRMKEILQERFGRLPNFDYGSNYAESYPTERRYGDALIPALFGAKVSFDEASGHPYAEEMNLSDEEAIQLQVPNIADNPILKSIFDQRRDKDIPTVGELGFEGVVNIAHKLRGQQMFMDFIEKPHVIRHILEVVCETIEKVVLHVRKWQDTEGSRPTYFVNCDCLINMISGNMYSEQLLEFDKRLHTTFDLFGIHTCNWSIDPYLDALAEVGDLAYLDMGADSDIDRVHELFPGVEPSVFFHPETLRRMTESEIHKAITDLGKRIGRGYILFSDLEVGTTDGQIRTAYEAAANL